MLSVDPGPQIASPPRSVQHGSPGLMTGLLNATAISRARDRSTRAEFPCQQRGGFHFPAGVVGSMEWLG